MKEKELYVDYKPQQHIYYVEKEDQQYGPIVSGSFLSKNYLDDYWLKKKNLELSLRTKVIDDKISPIEYYMTLQELSIADLAARVNIRRTKLKKYLKPQFFNKIRLPLLSKFAEVFDVPVANLFQVIITKEDDRSRLDINQLNTQNPAFVVTKIESK
jgi:transcriptional regulator with XRE-family HTH domain